MSAATATPTLQPPLFAVAIVPGHEEDQELLQNELKRTDRPAAGWVKRVYVDGDRLKADFAEVDPISEDLLNRHAYRKISAEFYTNFRDQGQEYGLVLRRVAMLGGEVPQVKSLADIPRVANGEAKGVEIFAAGEQRGRLWTVADLQQIAANFERLSSAGQTNYSDSATFTSLLVFHEARPMLKRFHATPAQLRERASKFTGRVKLAFQKFADEPAPTDAAPGDAAAPADVSRDDMVQMLAGWGMDLKVIDTIKDDAALAEIVRVVKGMMSGEPKPSDPPPPPTDPAPQPGTQMSATPPIAPAVQGQGNPSQVTIKYNDQNITLPADLFRPLVEAAVKPIQDQLGVARQDIASFQKDTKKSRVVGFCERMRAEGKLLPTEFEQTVARLQRADAVAKFSDSQTELDLQLAEIEARPCLLKMSEVVKTKANKTSPDEERQKVETFAEQHEGSLKSMGKTKEQYVSGFDALKAKRPGLTAEQYGVPAGK